MVYTIIGAVIYCTIGFIFGHQNIKASIERSDYAQKSQAYFFMIIFWPFYLFSELKVFAKKILKVMESDVKKYWH